MARALRVSFPFPLPLLPSHTLLGEGPPHLGPMEWGFPFPIKHKRRSRKLGFHTSLELQGSLGESYLIEGQAQSESGSPVFCLLR